MCTPRRWHHHGRRRGTQFCFDAIKELLEKPDIDQVPTATPGEPAQPTRRMDPIDEPRVTAAKDDSNTLDQPMTTADPPGAPGDVATESEGPEEAHNATNNAPGFGVQIIERLQSGIEALRAAETAMGRRTEGKFVPHAGDNQTLRNWITAAVNSTAKAYAVLTNSVSAYKALQERVNTLIKENQRLETENTELKCRAQDDRTKIVALESELAK